MSAPLAALVLVGLAGVPTVLLWTGQHFRTFPPATLRSWRGAVVGYGVSCAAVAVLLLVPPYTWPPPSRSTRIVLATALLAGPLLGAVVGAWWARRGG